MSARRARVALGLWTAWAVIVGLVVFDHAVELAGRHYLHAAGLAALTDGPYVRIDDWMRPAVSSGLRTGVAAAGGILAVGIAALRCAMRWARPCA